MTRTHICRTCAAWATEPGDGVEFPCHRHPAVEQPMKLADDWCLDWVAIQVPKELNSTEGKKPPGEWRPFKTAPRDGTAILVMRNDWPGLPTGHADKCNGINTVVAEWWEHDDRNGGEWVCYMDMSVEPRCPFEPTHWMPLPEPPAGDAP